ncbi:hypothetical protein GIB67_031255 [Kingdonia uniflora]|uniref:Uncharacterized protein n=1 Tax=Kingdonia uniflora TaxID=39325 RepID=A0A7J7NL48_9MAGN|nr:hypothetical protein GIB67_031255 [Kingdonia uniflora]
MYDSDDDVIILDVGVGDGLGDDIPIESTFNDYPAEIDPDNLDAEEELISLYLHLFGWVTPDGHTFKLRKSSMLIHTYKGKGKSKNKLARAGWVDLVLRAVKNITITETFYGHYHPEGAADGWFVAIDVNEQKWMINTEKHECDYNDYEGAIAIGIDFFGDSAVVRDGERGGRIGKNVGGIRGGGASGGDAVVRGGASAGTMRGGAVRSGASGDGIVVRGGAKAKL